MECACTYDKARGVITDGPEAVAMPTSTGS
jgi:hypothetical protein